MSSPGGRGQAHGARAGHHLDRAARERRVERAGSSFWSGYDLLWGPAPAPARRGVALDRTRIAKAAIRIADADGLDAVTMRRVAQELRTGAMSLYRHIPDKDALLSIMIDTVLGGNGDPVAAQWPRLRPDEWRANLRLMAEGTWRLCRAHPWYPEAAMVRPPLTPNALAGLEWALGMFDGYQLPVSTKMQFVGSVHFSVLSAALSRAIEQRTRARFDLSERETMAASWPFMQQVIGSGRYPRVVDFVVNAEHPDDETQMRAGVELILDGIGVRLAGARPKRARRAGDYPKNTSDSA